MQAVTVQRQAECQGGWVQAVHNTADAGTAVLAGFCLLMLLRSFPCPPPVFNSSTYTECDYASPKTRKPYPLPPPNTHAHAHNTHTQTLEHASLEVCCQQLLQLVQALVDDGQGREGGGLGGLAGDEHRQDRAVVLKVCDIV